jgi:hypothetical protein
MVTIALIVFLVFHVRIVKKSDCAQFICNADNWFAKLLLNFVNLVVRVVLVSHTFQSAVCSQTLTKPLKFKVNLLF